MRILIQVIGAIFFGLNLNFIYSQQYSDYIGFGHSAGITVTSSHSTTHNNDSQILTGSNQFTDLKGSSRFLRQATMGSNYESIEMASQIGLSSWLDNQFALSPVTFSSEYQRIYDEINAITSSATGDQFIHQNSILSFTFYEMGFKLPDVLRQKVAFALSQILVISPTTPALKNKGLLFAKYYDILYLNAFGNYRDILYDVTLDPAMGFYLSHYNNRKADIIQGSFPDENYAREIMQLFTIGLHELHNDGSLKLDENGKTIPTYNNKDIQELSKVFTGLSAKFYVGENDDISKEELHAVDLNSPMEMFENYHDRTEKILIDGTILPANQSGLDDINQAIDILFNHKNVGPFISRRLIQHLVKSNPSPQYINRISAIFNDNGLGERGDLEAVIRGILLDPEARECEWIDNQYAGKLIQPLERFTHLFSAFDLQTPSNKFWFNDNVDLFEKLQQSFLSSPTVFNFYSPFYAEKEFVAPNNLVSPEFQILNSTTSINYLNLIEETLKESPFRNQTDLNSSMSDVIMNPNDEPFLDPSDETNLYDQSNVNSIELILDRIDLILCSGQLSPNSKAIIKNTIIENINNDSSYNSRDIFNDIIYYIMISADYNILK